MVGRSLGETGVSLTPQRRGLAGPPCACIFVHAVIHATWVSIRQVKRPRKSALNVRNLEPSCEELRNIIARVKGPQPGPEPFKGLCKVDPEVLKEPEVEQRWRSADGPCCRRGRRDVTTTSSSPVLDSAAVPSQIGMRDFVGAGGLPQP